MMAGIPSLKSLLLMKAIAIHEASGQDITYSEVAFSLVVGGGKPGQGYPCVLVEVDNDSSSLRQSSARQQSDDL